MPIATRMPAPTPVQDSIPIPPKVPQLPDDVIARFPSLAEWQEDENSWWARATNALQSNNRTVSQSVTKQAKDTRNLTVSFNDFKVVIQDEVDTIVTDQVAMGRRIISVSAQVGVNQNIKIQNSAPVGPALNDYWIDNSNLATPITYKWSGVAWVEVTDPIAVAGVADERTARVTADGFLEGKYTLTVIAGNVVTGMNITSSSGGGTNVSSVIFRATDFQIYNGVLGKTMFSVSGTDVQLAGVLTVSTSGKVYIGTGTYGNANTAWYVDSSGNFSLKDKLTWDGTTLTITGAVTATSGTIGGWTLSSTTLSANNAILGSAGQLILGTANDVVYLSATDATYRIWIGNATAGSAAFRVTKAGVVTATSATVTGTINATAGYLGSGSAVVTIDSSGLDVGTSGRIVGGASGYNSGTGFWLGYSSGYKFFIGNSAGNKLTWDGTDLSIAGVFDVGSGDGHVRIGAGNAAITPAISFNDGTSGIFAYTAPSTLNLVVGNTVRAQLVNDNSPATGAPVGYFVCSHIIGNTDVYSYGPIQAAGALTIGGISTLNGALTVNSTIHSTGVVTFDTDITTGGRIQRPASTGWTVNVFDGTYEISFQYDGANLYARINDGGSPILLG